MSKIKDLTGVKVGRLIVIKLASKSISGKTRWICECECGSQTVVWSKSIVTGTTKSCGCLRKDVSKAKATTHGLSTSEPLYTIWCGMMNRCKATSTERNVKSYFSKGIKVCEEWANSPTAFVLWGKSNGYKKGLDIDRVDNNSDYSPDNCRFVTHSANCANQGTKRINRTGYSGVEKVRSGKFVSSIRYGKTRTHFGTFNTAWEACQARNEFIKKHNLPHKIQEKIDEQ